MLDTFVAAYVTSKGGLIRSVADDKFTTTPFFLGSIKLLKATMLVLLFTSSNNSISHRVHHITLVIFVDQEKMNPYNKQREHYSYPKVCTAGSCHF